MRFAGYRGRHLRVRPRRRGPVVVGTAAMLWASQSAAAHAAQHVVKKGETLSDIAVRYGTSTSALARANGLSNPNLIVAGTTLTVTSGGGSSSGTSSTHEVQAGESLWSIAQRYGTTVHALASANGIADPNLVAAGTTLTISGGGGSTTASSTGGTTHTLRAGETLSDIGARYGVSVESLAGANGLANPNLVVAGTSLTIPGAGATVTQPSTAPTSADVGYLLEQEALANGVNTSLIKALAYQESGWQEHVISSAGAIGVMQVMPGTARWINKVLLGGTSLNVRDTHDNIRMGVSYLRYLLSIMPTQDKALAAYYSGTDNVGSKLRRYQRVYVESVNALTARF